MGIQSVRWLGKAALGWCIALPLASVAAMPRVPATLPEYQHSSWDGKDGAPAGIQSMARTSDGWLWLGTNAGLFQFDGVTFRSHETLAGGDLRSHSIRQIRATATGDLWVFFSAGGASVLPNRDRDHPMRMTGIPDSTALGGGVEDADGRIWVTDAHDIYRSNGHVWERMDPADLGIPRTDGPQLVGDQRGDVWLVDGDKVWVRAASGPRFTPVAPTWKNLEAMFLSVEGRQIVLDQPEALQTRLQVLPAPAGSTLTTSYRNSDSAIGDGHGRLWSVACDVGELCLVPEGERLPRNGFRGGDDPWKAEGIPSPGAMCVLLDDDGSTWVGTKQGLERFRAAAATRVPLPVDTYFFVVIPNADGTVDVATDSNNGRNDDRFWHVGDVLEPLSPPGHAASAWWRESDGSLLLAGGTGAWSLKGGALKPFVLPAAVPGSRVRPQALARDSIGRLWIAYAEGPAWRNNAGTWYERGNVKDLPKGPVATIAVANDGIWFGYRNNALALLDATDQVVVFDARQGLATGSVNAMVTGGTMLVGGERGVEWFDGHRFHALRAQHADELSGVTGLLRDADGTLWVNGFKGLIRYPASESARALHDPSFEMTGRLFDDGDGVAGAAQQQRPLPTLTRGSDGRIWVASTRGLSTIDPTALPQNTRAPSLWIRALNGVAAQASEMTLAAGTRQVRVDFDVVSIARADRAEVRYRLVGSDAAWTEAGARRQAVFANLAPGTYRFEVTAGNEDGVWNLEGASLAFAIAPTFFQTAWFRGLCIVLALAAIWAAFVFRLRHERALLRQKMAVRHAERERIARELHDTLLQGIGGLLMRMQAWTSRRDLPAEIHVDIERASDQGREMLAQGRDRIAELRADDDQPVLLARALQAIGDNLTATQGPRFTLVDNAPGCTLRRDVAIEVCAIVHEAIANACAHSGGRAVTVKLQRSGDQLSIAVADDGRGVDAAELERAAGAGHWGVVGMRERARRIGARLAISSDASGGTRVMLEGITPKTIVRN